MALRKYKPTSPGRRFMSVSAFDEITKSEPEKSLVEPVKKRGGRNSYGRITTRHQGGGHKRRYRVIDFKRVTQVGLTVHEVDPERNLLLVKGAVPGPKNGFVEVREDKGRGRA